MFILRLLFCLVILISAVAAQTENYKITLRGSFDLENPDARILAHEFLDNGNGLLLVSPLHYQVWDTVNKKILAYAAHGIGDLYIDNFGALSPDREMVLVLAGRHDKKDLPPASVWDLRAKKRVAVLDKTSRPILFGMWSRNGKTLITASAQLQTNGARIHEGEVEISFWDGETLALNGTTILHNLSWFYLSNDGSRLFTAAAAPKSILGIPLAGIKANGVNVWNTKTAAVENVLQSGNEKSTVRTWSIAVNADGRLLALVFKNPSDEADNKMFLWDVARPEAPRLVIKTEPPIVDSSVSFSPDGKLIAVRSKDSVQIFDTQSGERKYRLPPKVDIPEVWLADNNILVDYSLEKLKAYETSSGKPLYERKIDYKTIENQTGSTTDSAGNTTYQTETLVVDSTTVVPHPMGKIYLTYSGQYVRVHDAKTGEVAKTLISPPLVLNKKKSRKNSEQLVSAAGFTPDGSTLFIINGRQTAITLWDVGPQ
jgi:WD40 repeat protein